MLHVVRDPPGLLALLSQYLHFKCLSGYITRITMKTVSFNILLFVSDNCQYSQKEYEGKGHGTDPLRLPVLAATDCGVD